MKTTVPEAARVMHERRVGDLVVVEGADLEPHLMFGVGQFYADFTQTSDENVIELLWDAKHWASAF